MAVFFVFFLNLVLISLFMRYMSELLEEKGVTPSKWYHRIVVGQGDVSFATKSALCQEERPLSRLKGNYEKL